MKYKHFLQVLMTYKKISDELSELNSIGFDFFEGKYELSRWVEYIVDATFASHYDEDGVEWINWFIYENDFGQRISENDEGELDHRAWDENGEPICYSYETLWNYVEKHHKLKQK